MRKNENTAIEAYSYLERLIYIGIPSLISLFQKKKAQMSTETSASNENIAFIVIRYNVFKTNNLNRHL